MFQPSSSPQSSQAQSSQALCGAFMEGLIRFLMPFFLGTAPDIDAAQAEILETLASYGTRTRAEMLAAARIIAFSMTTLDTLAEAKAAELSPAMKIRYRGCANGLNRSVLQTVKQLDESLARELMEPPMITPEPINDTPAAAEVQGAIEHAQAAIRAHRSASLPDTRPTSPVNQEERNKQLWAGALSDALKAISPPNGPVSRP